MGSRLKEDERNERIIRGLLKLPENRRCINCSSLGPQYVCTNFWTFVCTTCSGIHREFTHRVKSVSMAKFTSQEVSYLQEGGNQKARDVYLKEWDSKHQSGPDGSNIDRLRDFIKHVYVDRRFSGEKGLSRPPSGKMGERDDPYESRKSEGGSRSPPSEGSRREYNDFSKSPSRPEIINDWRREERLGNGSRQEERRGSDGETNAKLNSSPPPVRPVREILGDNATPLVVQPPPKLPANNGPAHIQAILPTVKKPEEKTKVEVKPEIVKSLIDFDDFEPSIDGKTTAAQPPQVDLSSSVASSTLDSNWASFEFPSNYQPSAAPSNTSPLESAFSQISLSTAPSPSVAPTSPAVNENASFGANLSSSLPTNASQYQPPAVPFGGSVTAQPYMKLGASSLGPPSASTEETISSGRRELPQDLFTSAYSPYHPPMPYWQPHLMGYNMQAIRMVQASPSFQQPMSINPFDVSDLPHVPRHPQPVAPMANPQGGIPNFSPMGLQQNASVFPAWMSAPAHPQFVPHLMQPSQAPFAHSSNQHMGGLSIEGSHHAVPSAQPYPSQGGNPFG